MRPTFYGKAFVEVVWDKGEKGIDAVVSNFISLIKKNGDWSKKDEIVRACETALRKKTGRSSLVIESARPLNEKQKEAILDKFRGGLYDFEEKINPDLLAGVRLVRDEERQFDASLQKKLKRIFSGLNRTKR
jgi:F0F1-type ATP synthase delta subunit